MRPKGRNLGKALEEDNYSSNRIPLVVPETEFLEESLAEQSEGVGIELELELELESNQESHQETTEEYHQETTKEYHQETTEELETTNLPHHDDEMVTLATTLNLDRDIAPHQSNSNHGIRTSSSKFPELFMNSPSAITQYRSSYDSALESQEIMAVRDGKTFVAFNDKQKIQLFAGGIKVNEMVQWFREGVTEYHAMTFDDFLDVWNGEFLPENYVFNLVSLAHESKQNGREIETYFKEHKEVQVRVGKATYGDGELVMNVFRGLEERMKNQVRNDPMMIGTGIHINDTLISTAVFASTFKPPPAFVNNFKRMIFRHWSLLDHRPRVAMQQPRPQQVPQANVAALGEALTKPLTPIEIAYLKSIGGCYRCRSIKPNHRWNECPGPIPGAPNRLVVPADFVLPAAPANVAAIGFAGDDYDGDAIVQEMLRDEQAEQDELVARLNAAGYSTSDDEYYG